MSCYFRHMQDIFNAAEIIVTPANKKQVDQAFHTIMGTLYKDCPATWREIKKSLLSDPGKREELIKKLQAALK